MLTNSTPLPEIVLRVVVIYVGLLAIVRIAGKREIGQLGPLDLLGMLLLSETVSPALTAEDHSLTASLVAAATLIGMAAIVGRLSYRWPPIERLIDGAPRVIIEDGRVDRQVANAERISDQELGTALRQEGVRSPEEVEQAVIEPSGRISVIKRRPQP